jgi:hypothetical protein
MMNLYKNRGGTPEEFVQVSSSIFLSFKLVVETNFMCVKHTARIPSPLPLRLAKTGRNHLNEEFTPLLPTGIGERF